MNKLNNKTTAIIALIFLLFGFWFFIFFNKVEQKPVLSQPPQTNLTVDNEVVKLSQQSLTVPVTITSDTSEDNDEDLADDLNQANLTVPASINIISNNAGLGGNKNSNTQVKPSASPSQPSFNTGIEKIGITIPTHTGAKEGSFLDEEIYQVKQTQKLVSLAPIENDQFRLDYSSKSLKFIVTFKGNFSASVKQETLSIWLNENGYSVVDQNKFIIK